MAIRHLYEQYGAEGYYKEHGDAYENPHKAEIDALVRQNFDFMDVSGKVLDLAAGGGEVSSTLQRLGVEDIIGCDPFTHTLYRKNTGLDCLSLSFEDIIRQGLPQDTYFSSVICSFAMHLCPEKQLYALCTQLFDRSAQLFIITPHKRPELEKLSGIELVHDDFVLTTRGKQVRLRMYQRLY